MLVLAVGRDLKLRTLAIVYYPPNHAVQQFSEVQLLFRNAALLPSRDELFNFSVEFRESNATVSIRQPIIIAIPVNLKNHVELEAAGFLGGKCWEREELDRRLSAALEEGGNHWQCHGKVSMKMAQLM